MNIFKRTADALVPVELPVFRNYWRATSRYPTLPPRYIVLYQLNHKPEIGCDNRDAGFVHYMRVDFFGDRVMDDEIRAARAALSAAGYAVGEDRPISDDKEGQGYHSVLDASYLEMEEMA